MTSIKRQPNSTNGVSEIRRIPYRTTKKLGRSHKVDKISTRSYEEAIWQEKTKYTGTEGRRQCVVES